MKQLIIGIILGSVLTAGVGFASNFYDSHGKPNAPTGSIQQYDYFRQRGFFLDQQAIRGQGEELRRHPCGK